MKRIVTELLFAAGLAAIVWLLLHLGLRPVGHALAAIGVHNIDAVHWTSRVKPTKVIGYSILVYDFR